MSGGNNSKMLDSEVQFIIDNYDKMTVDNIAEELGRSRASIFKVKRKYGLTVNNKWNDEEDLILSSVYNYIPISDIVKQMNRSVYSIKNRAKQLNLIEPSKSIPWNEDSLNILINNYGCIDNDELSTILNRDIVSIKNKAFKLGLTEKKIIWTDDEVDIIKKYYSTTSTKDLQGIIPNKSEQQIRAKATYLGVKKDNCIVSWSDSEIDILRCMQDKTLDDISEEISKPRDAIYRKMESLGLPYIKTKNIDIGEKCKCSKCGEVLLYTEENFSTNAKKTGRVCIRCKNKTNNIKKYKDKFNIHLDWDFMFDTYTINEWVDMVVNGNINMLPLEIVSDKEKLFVGFRHLVSKYLNLSTREEILTLNSKINHKGFGMINNYAFKNYESFNDFIVDLYECYKIKHYEFQVVKKGYFNDMKNVKEYLDYVITNVLNCDIENCEMYSKYFTEKVLVDLGLSRVIHIKKSFGFGTYYELLYSVFGDVINEDVFNINKAFDGTILDSKEELLVYEFIKNNITNKIKATNRKRSNMYINGNEKYAPDFVIPCKDRSKKIIIEYFGLYYNDFKYDSKMIINYNEKAKRKIEYFESMEDVLFIALYREDLKFNCKGVSEKLASFYYVIE